jgi:hypothetical protein
MQKQSGSPAAPLKHRAGGRSRLLFGGQANSHGYHVNGAVNGESACPTSI